ncbi:hypothetical protein GCM10011496_00300 [Polaromonas eurypsychrophila]|uniref:Uncharacterized protein n=1 Tax=Polaromonas eurypsychrophila TaxID=1614635 RepID=A0A916S4A1_9BURK|nr:hypothetical protein GCM10011496_00300 [Polaromonas eurypsychrophila]
MDRWIVHGIDPARHVAFTYAKKWKNLYESRPGQAKPVIVLLQDIGGVVERISSIVVTPPATLSAPASRSGRMPSVTA